MKIKYTSSLAILFLITNAILAQTPDWQQSIRYKMEIDVDAPKHQFSGVQYVQYDNNSPDTLDKVFFHLYFNAFQPGSMMDVRSRTISDPDSRVGSRIEALSAEEIGYHQISVMKQDGQDLNFIVEGTVAEVSLNKPILPGVSTLFELRYDSQVPLQIRRSGRDNKEGIEFSMAQWYPKMAEYDHEGWHAHPYVGREFHGVWGDFDVKINIDKKYILGATGELQNHDDIGYGYEKGKKPKNHKGKKLNWHFIANNVHDFVWAADPDYKHIRHTTQDGIELHFLYQENEKTKDIWPQLPRAMDEAFQYINDRFGKYPYPVYSFIQGGDGGMEYPMATLITGERTWGSLVGVSVHELMHSWYQMILATNESLYSWMDEGFTSYASAHVMNHLKKEQIIPGEVENNPALGSVRGYCNFAKSGMEEPLTTHADHYNTNRAYGIASYVKGSATISQLEYIIGKPATDQGMLRYFNTWKFKHPDANDFFRIMEKTSGLELDWFRGDWVNSTRTMDYAVDSIYANDLNSTMVLLSNLGSFAMPLDVEVTYADGTKSMHNIALTMMRGNKMSDEMSIDKIEMDWPWTHPSYKLKIDKPLSMIRKVSIDPTGRMADIYTENNVYPRETKEIEQTK